MDFLCIFVCFLHVLERTAFETLFASSSRRYRIQWLYQFQTLKAPIKLSRKMAIFEFSSSNGYSSFSLNFECRSITISVIEDENNNHLSYRIWLPYDLQSDTSCNERGYENAAGGSCITTFQGKKYSMI